MREIKFRALLENGMTIEAPSESWSIALHDTGHMAQLWSSDGIVDEVPIKELVQYTGLTDKNGVEIYEGDVIKHEHSYNGYSGFGVVEFLDGCFVLNRDYPEPCEEGFFILDATNTGVAGNVYENPELLNE